MADFCTACHQPIPLTAERKLEILVAHVRNLGMKNRPHQEYQEFQRGYFDGLEHTFDEATRALLAIGVRR